MNLTMRRAEHEQNLPPVVMVLNLGSEDYRQLQQYPVVTCPSEDFTERVFESYRQSQTYLGATLPDENPSSTLLIWEESRKEEKARLSDLFSQLVKQWHKERGITSSPSKMFKCPAYQQIISMGEEAIPLILAQLTREGDDPDHWYAALEAITEEDPVPEDAYGDTVQIAKAWLSWAEERNVRYLEES